MSSSNSVRSLDDARRSRSAAAGESCLPAAGMFTAPDGSDLYFEDSGGTGPVHFYIYGLGCSICHWKYPREYFRARGVRQIWMDFRGHGRSPRPRSSETLTIATIMADIEALCLFRKVKRALFLGQSMGGTIALALAAKFPDLVHGLVLIASPGRDPSLNFHAQPVSRWIWQGLIELNRTVPRLMPLLAQATAPVSDTRAFRLAMIEVVRAGGFNPKLSKTADIDEYVGKVLATNPKLFFDLAADLATFDVADVAGRVACPTLMIAGAIDQIVPLPEAQRIAKLLPRGELAVLPHGSHCPHFDDPGWVNRRIETFTHVHQM